MMSDAIDDALDNDEAEDETEELTNQVTLFLCRLKISNEYCFSYSILVNGDIFNLITHID